MLTVSDYVAKENKRLSRQIAISVQIYTVTLGKSEDFNATFTGFLKKIGNMTYSSAAIPGIVNSNFTSSNMGTLNVAILNSSGDKMYGAEIFRALSAVGNTSQVAQFSMTTLNNRPVSRRVGTDRSYIQSVNESTTYTTSSQCSTS